LSLDTVVGGNGTPPEPDWSTIFTDDLDLAAARQFWRGIVSEMRDAGTLVVENGHAIQRLVIFRLEFDRAARNVIEQGKILRAKKTKTPQINPEWTCMKQAGEAVADLESDLGISPRRRNAAGKVTRAKKKTTAADAYLKPVSK
jgi:P27 family predicted phage terminase small subunit